MNDQRCCEEALYDIPLLRGFAGLDAGVDTMPVRLRYSTSKQMFAEVNAILSEQGWLLYFYLLIWL